MYLTYHICRASPLSNQPPGPASQWLQDVLENQVTEALQPVRPDRPLRRLIPTGLIPGGMQDPAEGEEKDELWHLGSDWKIGSWILLENGNGNIKPTKPSITKVKKDMYTAIVAIK